MHSPKKIILLSLVVSALLMLGKFGAYMITSSNAILTDAAESIVNVLASAFAFYSIYLSAQPRDVNHPYGHGKVEFFSMFVEGALILTAGILVIFKSVYNLFYPEAVKDLMDGALIIAFTGVINFVLGYFLVKESKKYHSFTLYADGKHLQTDAYSSLGLVIGLLLIVVTKINYLDSVISIGLGVYIIFNGYKLVRRSVAGLMDESDFEKVTSLVNVLNANRHDAWIDVHNLRTQQYGHELHIDCHVTLPYYLDLNHVHEEISQIDAVVNEKSSIRTEFFIHADPCLPACCHYCRVKGCPVRSEEQRLDIVWTMNNVTRNHKHFE
ncbi:cation diffusion facilitator family transporter [Hufsiella ginkgonis]|uniref:Cation diffusion facilitator family transporter n=1 Tax=Hufsiella ginkgonis TaxID=2695274 RepID=A0A7K1XXS5_9SPHI|nr:cation diffusion facilitator family transporter [Hufsiella ginkgonis]MXV15539.1 cation diffusion facilitator family transporter [Hufsiella ginkgonis]